MRTNPGATSRRLLGHLISGGPAHRADISRALGVSRTTVTNLVADLTGSGVLVPLQGDEPAPPVADALRPPLKQQLGISVAHGVLVSVVFRMTSVTVTVGTLDGRVLAADTVAIERAALGEDRMDTAHSLLQRVLAAVVPACSTWTPGRRPASSTPLMTSPSRGLSGYPAAARTTVTAAE